MLAAQFGPAARTGSTNSAHDAAFGPGAGRHHDVPAAHAMGRSSVITPKEKEMESNGTLATNGCAGFPTAAVLDGSTGFRQYSDEQVRQLVEALEEPFDPREIKWRVTNTTADKRRGQMLAYADPRAYTDRLNEVFTVRGWTRDYSVQTINNVERRMSNGSQIAGKLVVTCRLTIHGLGTHSGIGEEWADNENAGTAAEAQAFKRACSCFGLGRYLYSLEGAWVDLDDRKQPRSTPKLPEWALPKKRQNGTTAKSANGHAPSNNSHPRVENWKPQDMAALRAHLKSLSEQLGYSLSRSVLTTMAKTEMLEKVPAALLAAVSSKMEDTLRGVERLRAATAVVGQKRYSQLCRDLTFASDALDDIPDRTGLRQLVETLEKEAAAVTSRGR
jgi:hypothetical protein